MTKSGPFSSAEIRQQFLDFFANKGHTIVPSASLIPHSDPTLLFTNAGMNQFKDVFLGIGSRPYTRVADTQKCMRVSGKHNDLEEVGISSYHHTFFEMLGNWSFGDYYKREAIMWAWELLTGTWQLPKRDLYATVFEDDQGDLGRDDEAIDQWRQVTDMDPDHIIGFGRKDNFWEMGDAGPCGPCSEIHLDRGSELCDMADVPGHICRVNGDCQRIVELWNLVFIQYNRRADGTLEPLPAKHVDTGAGFERLVSVMQGTRSNYETDLFTGILARLQEMLGHTPEERQDRQVAYRVIADHTRAAAFLIADGALPGNVGRNYVLRMIIRRAARFGKGLGLVDPFIARIAEVVISEMGTHFIELGERREHILRTLTAEEERFQRTLDTALDRLDHVLSALRSTGASNINGETAFDLYATYGLPLEITRDVAGERGFAVDEDEFKRAAEAHKLVSGAGAIGSIDADRLGRYSRVMEVLTERGMLIDGVDHQPYGELALDTQLLAILTEGELVESADEGDEVEVVVAATPYYVEAGGQVGDIGLIKGATGWQIEVSDVHVPLAGLVVHSGKVRSGRAKVGDSALVMVDADRRWDIMRNHTATHVLHHELRAVLGDHVLQQGSLVAPDRFRFDFNHPDMVAAEELAAVERNVNKVILDNFAVRAGYTTLQDAKERGAMALFGEKYGDIVRTIRIGDQTAYSLELCGGTHVNQTSEIGLFHLVSEGSVGANLRRVEGVTGRRAQTLAHEGLQTLDRAAAALSTTPAGVDDRVAALLDEVQSAQREVARLERALARVTFERLVESRVQRVEGVPVLAATIDNVSAESLREMTDWFRDRVGSGIVALGTVLNDRPLIFIAVTPDLVARGLKAGDLVRPVAAVIGGGGGGKPTLAQAGGKDAARLPEAVGLISGLVSQSLAASD